MKTRIPAVSLFILIAVIGLALSTVVTTAQAASISLKFNSLGVYPQLATANSQRWFRANVTWDRSQVNAGTDEAPVYVVKEWVVGVYLESRNASYNAGYGGNMITDNGPQYGVARHDQGSRDTGNVTYTVGPFAGLQLQ